MYGVKWVEGTFKDGKWDPTSKLIFPNSFNGEVETDVRKIIQFKDLYKRHDY